MSTIQDVIRSAERHAAEMQCMLDTAGFQGPIRSMESHTAIVQGALDAVASAQAGIERTGRFAEICVQLKWPPPWHMPSRLIDRITAGYHAGALTQDETAGIFGHAVRALHRPSAQAAVSARGPVPRRVPIREEEGAEAQQRLDPLPAGPAPRPIRVQGPRYQEPCSPH